MKLFGCQGVGGSNPSFSATFLFVKGEPGKRAARVREAPSCNCQPGELPAASRFRKAASASPSTRSPSPLTFMDRRTFKNFVIGSALMLIAAVVFLGIESHGRLAESRFGVVAILVIALLLFLAAFLSRNERHD
jgi:hypothetical protein